MMGMKMSDESEGLRAGRARIRKLRWTVGLSLLGVCAVGAIVTLGRFQPGGAPGRLPPSWALIAVLAMIVVLPLTIHFLNRVSDELDRMDTLRANSFGLYAGLLGQWCWMTLSIGGLVPPPNVLLIFMATALVTLGRYASLKLARR